MVMPGCARWAATAYCWWRAPAMICSVASCRSGHTCWRKNSTARTLGRWAKLPMKRMRRASGAMAAGRKRSRSTPLGRVTAGADGTLRRACSLLVATRPTGRNAARLRSNGGGAEAVEIDAVREGDGGGRCHHAAVLFAHGDDTVHGAPRGGFKLAPEVELAAQIPTVVEMEKLLVEVEGDVVFHQDGAGGGAIGGILRELGELQLGDGGG